MDMPERLLQPSDSNEVSDVIRRQLLPISNRVVVFGSRLSGAFDLAEALDRYLRVRDVPDVSLVVERNIERIISAFYGRGKESIGDTLPKGVVVLPEMRWYPEGIGMTVNTHRGELYAGIKYSTVFGYIKSICDENGVPIVDFNNDSTQGELITGVDKLLTDPDERQP